MTSKHVAILCQSAQLLEAFNKDRASLPQPMPNPPPSAPMLLPTPDPHIQEMINEKLKKAEDLGKTPVACTCLSLRFHYMFQINAIYLCSMLVSHCGCVFQSYNSYFSMLSPLLS